jgi:hypothetical protein
MTKEQLKRASSIQFRISVIEKNLEKMHSARKNDWNGVEVTPNQAKADYVTVPQRIVSKIWDIIEEDYKKEIEQLNKEFLEL